MTPLIRSILVPTDLSAESRRAVDFAVLLADKFEATLELLHVWEPLRYLPPDAMLAVPGWSPLSVEDFARQEARRELEELARSLRKEGRLLRTRLEVGAAAPTILDVAGEAFDLVVMGTHGRTGLSRLVLGSVAQKVVAGAPCPVLTVRGELEKEREARR